MPQQLDPYFIRRTLALILRGSETSLQAVRLVRPEYFEPPLRELIGEIKKIYTDHHQVPTITTLKGLLGYRFRSNTTELALMHHLLDDGVVSIEQDRDDPIMMDVLLGFCKDRAMALAIRDASDALDRGQPERVRGLIDEAYHVGTELDMGLDFKDYINHMMAYYSRQEERRMSTGIGCVDTALGGGLPAGALGLIAAPKGKGKSIMLLNIAIGALWYGKTVLYYTMEMEESEIFQRAAINASGIELMGHDAETANRIRQVVMEKVDSMIGRFHVKMFPDGQATVPDLRSHAEMYAVQTGFRPDLIIVDGGYNLRPTGRYNSIWDGEIEIFRSLKGWAQETRTPMWTVDQADPSAYSDEVIEIQYVRGSKAKIHIASCVFFLCQTPAQAAMDVPIMRIYIAHVRNARSEYSVWTAYEKSKMKVRDLNDDERKAIDAKVKSDLEAREQAKVSHAAGKRGGKGKGKKQDSPVA